MTVENQARLTFLAAVTDKINPSFSSFRMLGRNYEPLRNEA
jgi:hypothetical protein